MEKQSIEKYSLSENNWMCLENFMYHITPHYSYVQTSTDDYNYHNSMY